MASGSGTPITLRNWMFSGAGKGNVCPTWKTAFKCNPTAACATDNITDRQYCCEDQQGMCWIHAATCATDGSTFNCTRGSTTWCCLTDREICTEAAGQTNICWASNPRNVLQDIAPNALKSLYSSLSSAEPSASSYTFDPLLLMAATSATSTSSSTSSRTTSTPAPPNSTGGDTQNPNGGSGAANNNNNGTSPPITSTNSGLGSGAIAGIVVGVLGAIALGAALAWFLMRKKKKQDDTIPGGPGTGAPEVAFNHPSDQKYMYAGSPSSYVPTPMSGDMVTPQSGYQYSAPAQPVGELPAAHQHYYAELPSEQTKR